MVLAHIIGPDQADVDYLKHDMKNELFAPEATLIVLKGGLVLSGRSVGCGFAEIGEHPVIVEALARGATMAVMPALTCLSKAGNQGARCLGDRRLAAVSLMGIAAIVAKPLMGVLSDVLGGRCKFLTFASFLVFVVMLFVLGTRT